MNIGTHGNVTPDEARKIAKQRAGEVAFGHDPQAKLKTAKAIASNTVASIWDDYAKRKLATKRSAAPQQSAFDRLVRPRIGDLPIYDLRRSDMTKLFDAIEDTNGVTMSDNMLRYLRTCFRWQQKRDDDFVSPIVSGMARRRRRNAPDRGSYEDHEIRAVWKATEQSTSYNAFIRFLLLTACRRDEARLMVWSELDGTVWTLPAARNKTKLVFLRPLSDDAKAILKALPRGNAYVFTDTGKAMGSPGKRKAKLDQDSGTTGWTLHDLRRTARSLMSRAKVPSDHAELCLGHVIPGIRATYDRHSYAEQRSAKHSRHWLSSSAQSSPSVPLYV